MRSQLTDDFMLKLSTTRFPSLSLFLLTLISAATVLLPCVSSPAAGATVPKWERFELRLENSSNYANPAQDATLTAIFASPKGASRKVYGFWDGGNAWKVRFAPNETGRWTYKTICSDANNK